MREYVIAHDVGTSSVKAALVEQLGQRVTVVQGSPLNLKITTRDDLKLAEQVLRVLPQSKPEGFSTQP